MPAVVQAPLRRAHPALERARGQRPWIRSLLAALARYRELRPRAAITLARGHGARRDSRTRFANRWPKAGAPLAPARPRAYLGRHGLHTLGSAGRSRSARRTPLGRIYT